jgi:hypothetical protein
VERFVRLLTSLMLIGTLAIGLPSDATRAVTTDGPAAPAAKIVDLPPLATAIIDDTVVPGTLRVEMSVAFESTAAADVLVLREPWLRQAQMLALGEFARLHVNPDAPVDVDRLAARMQQSLAQAAIPGGRILIRQVRARPA